MPHIHDKVDFTVEVFIVCKDKVLLRKHDKYGIWLSVGGHIELDEDPNQGALREVREEVGLDIELFNNCPHPLAKTDTFSQLIPPQFMNRHRINPSHEHVTLVYFASSATDKLVLSEKEKSDACRWFSRDELDDPQYNVGNNIRMYAKAALKALGKG